MSSPRRERKVVTVLFADLVGFTSRAERMDPEDVRELLSPYYYRLRSELEHFGGTVEKFIGDAVMALFGAPLAHEDDPERAVRAAFAIRDWVEKRSGCRCGSPSTPARRSSRSMRARRRRGDGRRRRRQHDCAAPERRSRERDPRRREHLPGDAARDRVPRGRAGRGQGKEEPIAVWEALQARASLGVDVPLEARTALVGRERELGVLRDALHRVREERSPQLVTLVGVPGIGKSRLLSSSRDRRRRARPDLVAAGALAAVRGRGQLLGPGGDGERAGGDSRDRLSGGRGEAGAMGDVIAVPAEARGCGDTSPAGRPVRRRDSGDSAGEAFAAWRRFFEALAEQRPLVLVFEDLHWADDGLLDFVDHLVDWAAEVPLLVVGTARPELLERRPGWGGGKANATTLSLSPLSRRETARLVGSLLDRPLLPAARKRTAGAGRGNPLYAEQFARMLRSAAPARRCRCPSPSRGSSARGSTRCRRDEKRLLQDAAVIGKVFWTSAVAAPRGRDSLDERCTRSSASSSSAASDALRWPPRPSTRSSICCCATSPTARFRGRAGREALPRR